MLGKQGNIIKKVDKKRYDAVNNTWYIVPGETETKEMLFIQTSADIPKEVQPPNSAENPVINFNPPFIVENLDLTEEDEDFPL